MKVFNIYWKSGETGASDKIRTVHVVSESITKAIARFQKTHHPKRIIESVCLESKEVLLDIE